MPRILAPSDPAIREAADRLRAGDVVAFPTETVYGLGADTFNTRALDRVFDLKGRPFDNPLIAHVIDAGMARDRLAAAWDARCDVLAAAFWPGPLAIIVPRRAEVPARATAGRDTIAVRSPSHPVAQQLLRAFGGPLSAPSANRSGRVSPTTAPHVAADFSDTDDLLVLDGGSCRVGIESTVLDMTQGVPTILRPGSITLDLLRAVIGDVHAIESSAQGASPGTSPRHYSPCTPARLLDEHDIRNEVMRAAAGGPPLAILSHSPSLHAALRRATALVTVIVMPQDPAEYAERLYAALREADESEPGSILIEEPPSHEGRWAAIWDRIRRATTP